MPNPPLDPQRFDEMLENGSRRLWGLPSIAQCLGVSTDTARRWANDPACTVPIYRPDGKWLAIRSELLAWLRRRATDC